MTMSHIQWLSDFGSPHVVDAAVRGTILLVAACALAWLVRRSAAAVRHGVWALTVVGLLALPVLSLTLPAWHAPFAPSAPTTQPQAHPRGNDGGEVLIAFDAPGNPVPRQNANAKGRSEEHTSELQSLR